ncbi:MAG: hypothetical protein LBD02_10195 [Christensenellaceae bacterium]|jgi:uncharacterized membrane protein YcgQ (UPF0703/DUF1980 family)|nr:hypothetical protein [Christensenellaceae bacterium]
MKKLIIVLIIGVMLLAGCDNKVTKTNPPTDNNAPSLAAPAKSPSQAPSEQTEEPTPNQPEASVAAPSGDVVAIKEKMFIAQLNDVYLNQDTYLGKTIKFEGMFTQYTWDEQGLTCYLVYRNSPGCCGADGQAGFEVIWPDGSNQAYPNENDWVEAVGVLEEYEEDGYKYLRLALSSLTVLPTRGAEFVSQ